VEVVKGLANKKVTPGYAYIRERRLYEPVLDRNRLSYNFSNAVMSHKDSTIDYDEAVQKISIDYRLSESKEYGYNDKIYQGKYVCEKFCAVKRKLSWIEFVWNHEGMDSVMEDKP
jgi:hypothetical protein